MIPIRASSLGELFDCPARWEAKNIRKLRTPSGAAAQIGTAIHAGTALYDAHRLDGETPISVDDAAGAVVDAIHKPEQEVVWDDADPRDAERVALALHARYCTTLAPRQTYIAVEMTCEGLELPELGIQLTGTLDRLRETPAGIGVADLKSGATAVSADGVVKTSAHKAQLGVYELLAEASIGRAVSAPAQVIGLNTGKTAAAQRVGTAEVTGARDALLGTEEEPGLLQHAATLLKSGVFFGNPRSMLCSPKFCPIHGSCRFRG